MKRSLGSAPGGRLIVSHFGLFPSGGTEHLLPAEDRHQLDNLHFLLRLPVLM